MKADRGKLSVKIAGQLQHDAARTKIVAGCAVYYDPRLQQWQGHGEEDLGGGCGALWALLVGFVPTVGIACVGGSERVIRQPYTLRPR